MELLTVEWKNKFTTLLNETRKSLLVISPFITENAVNLLESIVKKSSISIEILTRCNDIDFLNNASDISAIRKLINFGAKVKAKKHLHAKAYIFDGIKAIVTSANFTGGGLNRNIELGVYLEDTNNDQLFDKIKDLYRSCRINVTLKDIDEIEKRLKDIDNNFVKDIDSANFIDIGDDEYDFNDEIQLRSNSESSRIDSLISDKNHHKFFNKYKGRLVGELKRSKYCNISIETYVWLCGWSNTTRGYKKSMEIVKELCREMFGYELPEYIFKHGIHYNLKDYRYKTNESKRSAIKSIIIEYHEDKINLSR